MKTVPFQISEEIPVLAECDVLVIGGGPGGFGAAVMSAGCGARTVLAERHGTLGGTAFHSEVAPMMRNHYSPNADWNDARTMDRPVYAKLMRKAHAWRPAPEGAAPWDEHDLQINKNYLSLAMEELCLEAGVRLLFHFQLVRVLCDGRKITHAVFVTPSGFAAVKAGSFIDATGNGDLAALAGCRFEYGDAEHGLCQPMTFCFKLENVDLARWDRAGMQRLYQQARENGEIHCNRDLLLILDCAEPGVLQFNTTRVQQKSALDALERSEAELEGRRQMREIVSWMRKTIPGFERAQIRSMASEIGVRESRRIKGRAYLTADAFSRREKFPDAILRCNYPIDVHSASGTETTLISMDLSEYFEVPFGCIAAADKDNLLIAGRPISVSHEIHASCRVMPAACSIGQAAGGACALALKKGCEPCLLPGTEVRAFLKERGAWL